MAKKKTHWSKNTFSDRDVEVLRNAEYFTTFRFHGIDGRDRLEFKTLEDARADQGDDPKALVYACYGMRDALIPRPASSQSSCYRVILC